MKQSLIDEVKNKIVDEEEIIISRFNENQIPIVYKTPVALIDNKLAIGPLNDEQKMSITKELKKKQICRIALNVVLNEKSELDKEVIVIGFGKELYKVKNSNTSDKYYLCIEIEEMI